MKRGSIGGIAVAAAAILAGAYISLSARVFLAARDTDSANVAELQRAILSEPDDAALHYAFGRQLWLQAHDVKASIKEYQAATRINPYAADYWIELAAAATVAGDDSVRDNALTRAERAAPFDTTVLWDVANLKLMKGDMHAGLTQMRTAMQYGDVNLDAVLSACWRLTQNMDLMLADAVPPKPVAYETVLRHAMWRQSVDDAQKVWRSAQRLGIPIDKKMSLGYFDFLLEHGRAAEAEQQWQALAHPSKTFAGYQATDQNLVVNPRFELPILNAGRDWRYEAAQDASVTIDPGTTHGGHASAEVRFEGTPKEAGLYQLVPVSPGGVYQLSAFLRTDLEGTHGPRLAVFDAATNQRVFMSEPAPGQSDWQQLGGTFTVPAATSLVAVRVIRWPWETQIRGRFWLGDVTLRAAF